MLCQICGAELPSQSRGKPRKFCSEKCRKQQYSTPCVDCGAPTSGNDGHGPRASKRCLPCGSAHSANLAKSRGRERRALVERLWREGKLAREIGAILGWNGGAAATHISMLRARGYDLPYRRPPEWRARMLVGADERMRKARAARGQAR
jgi:endogenous inhibitor of DNA gyrase (YacG/DUF329 family)